MLDEILECSPHEHRSLQMSKSTSGFKWSIWLRNVQTAVGKYVSLLWNMQHASPKQFSQMTCFVSCYSSILHDSNMLKLCTRFASSLCCGAENMRRLISLLACCPIWGYQESSCAFIIHRFVVTLCALRQKFLGRSWKKVELMLVSRWSLDISWVKPMINLKK